MEMGQLKFKLIEMSNVMRQMQEQIKKQMIQMQT